MAINFTLTWDQGQLAKLRGAEIDKVLAKAVRNAGDQAARGLVTQAIKLVRSRRNLKSGYLRQLIRLRRPGKSADLAGMVWRVSVDRQPIPLSKYPHTTSRRGTRVRLGPGQTLLLKRVFEVNGRLFERAGRARLPIKQKLSSRPADIIEEGASIAALFDKARARMAEAFSVQVEAQLAKFGGR